jgi:hypothetical protein
VLLLLTIGISCKKDDSPTINWIMYEVNDIENSGVSGHIHIFLDNNTLVTTGNIGSNFK